MKKIGFIGLGIMGKPMCRHLIEQGFKVYVNDINSATVSDMVSLGAFPADYATIAEEAEIILLSLPDGGIVRGLVENPAFYEALREESIIIDTSSIKPEEAKEFYKLFAAKKVSYLDAPVSGGEDGAKAGSLVFMVGGDHSAFESVKELMNYLASKVTYIGDSGAGSVTKLVNQIIVNLNILVVSEAFAFCKKAGVDPVNAFEAINKGYGQSTVMDSKLPQILARNFMPGATINTNRKDIHNVLDTADKLDSYLPLTASLFEIQKSLVNNGKGQEDHGAYIKYYENILDIVVE